jgi:tungstate transport system ATP-binding protein
MSSPPVLSIPVVELAQVRVAHGGRVVLDVPALTVRGGEILVVIGPNGAGKSTLLRVIGLLEGPAGGAVRFQGERVGPGDALAVRRRMASAFQEPLLADTTVAENVAMGLSFRGVSAADAAPRVARWLTRLGVGALGARQARTLSGGEAQRVALARALVLEPELLLLDEPFSALDQPSREGLIEDLGAILRADRITTVLVTHDRGEALALGDRVAVMMGGRILQVDTPAQVFRAPVSEAVARFVGVETILDCRVLEHDGEITVVQVGGRTIEVAQPAAPGEVVRVCLRPEDVTLLVPEPADRASSARNRLTGKVVRIVPSGPHLRVSVDCGFILAALVTHRSAESLRLGEGVPISVQFKATALHLLRPGGGAGAAAASLDTATRPGV